jgi:sterol desaturase/sphingolipid hydroxylase (fatty acid hydroxylase superfamily)
MLETSLRLGFFAATFAAMALWEAAAPRRQLVQPRLARWPANLGLGFLNSAMLRILGAGALISAAAFAAEHEVGLNHWLSAPVWTAWLVTILALDFTVYLQHVMVHAVPVFWRLHRVHHADLGFDASTGVRFHPLEIFVSTLLKLAVVVLVGAVPWAIVAFEILLSSSSLFNHGNVTMPESLDRWLRWLVVTPDMHRIHHSSRVIETNSNFGFSFSWWDRLCGTYRGEPALGQLGLEIGLSEYRKPLRLGELLLLPFRGSAGSYTFAGTRSADHPKISPEDLRERLSAPEPPVVLDVRTRAELEGPLGRVGGAVNIPVDELPNRVEEISAWRARLLVPV